jgi:hypothetical protein
MPVFRPWLLAGLALLLSVSQAGAQAAPDTTQLRSIETQVAELRGLVPLADPELQVLDHTALSSYLSDEFARNYLPEEREADQKEMVAFGFIRPADDLVQIELKLLNEQVVGIYDPDVKSMFVVADGGEFGPAARITYAHEFNHALQDQYYDLNKLAPKHHTNNDRSLAVHGLIEGDAIMLQTMWAQRYLTQAEMLKLLQGADASDAGLAETPLIVRSELLFPYTDGFSFVRQVYRQAGNSFAAINDVLIHPPESTAQVLHPDKYRAQVRPVDVQLPELSGAVGDGGRPVGSGVLGELDTRVLLEQWGTPHSDATRIAGGWAGDHWQLVENGSHTAMAYRSTWVTPEAAADFFGAYSQGLRTRFTGATSAQSTSMRETLTTSDSVTDASVQGTDVLCVIASDRETANAVLAALSVPGV